MHGGHDSGRCTPEQQEKLIETKVRLTFLAGGLACSSFPRSVRRRSSIWRFSSEAISTWTESFAS